MQAVVIHQFGGPQQLQVEEVPTPEPRGDEVLVSVKAASINPSDVKNVAGTMHGTTLPRIPGRDFAGTVVSGPADLLNREVWGTGGDIGFTRDGSHAQYILLPRTALTPKPPTLSMESAGSAGLTFVTAWSAMVVAAAISKGETALIIGAAGGVGSAAVQIATSHGARVIGAVRDEKDFDPARQNGANEVVSTRAANFADTIRSLTANRGPDVIFDTTGMMFAESVELAAMDARIPIITAPPDGKSSLNLRTIYRHTLRILGVDTRGLNAIACAKLLAEINPGFASGIFKATAGKSFPLNSAVEAYEQAAHGGARIFLRPNV